MRLLPLAPGDIVMFHDDLLHGGAVNRGQKCRISIELTILFRRRTEALSRAANSLLACKEADG